MCPPRRSSSRIASSRFTGVPAPASASELSRRVSFMTSAVKESPSIAVAVRQTPLTEIESPLESSAVRRLETRRSTPSAERSTPEISPRSATSPVNRSPLLDPARQQQIVADPLAGQRQRPDRVGDVLDALALERIARAASAEQDRRHEQPHLVDLAGIQERTGELRTALEQQRGHARGTEQIECG